MIKLTDIYGQTICINHEHIVSFSASLTEATTRIVTVNDSVFVKNTPEEILEAIIAAKQNV